MRVHYDEKIDLLYIRLDEKKQKVINKRIFEDIVIDMGKDDKIVGIEILDASKHLDLQNLLPLKIDVSSRAARKAGP